MINDGDAPREFSGLVVPQHGSLEVTGDLFVPTGSLTATVR